MIVQALFRPRFYASAFLVAALAAAGVSSSVHVRHAPPPEVARIAKAETKPAEPAKPKSRIIIKKTRCFFLSPLYFETNRAEVRQNQMPFLESLVHDMKTIPEIKHVYISGFRAKRERQGVDLERAQATRDAFIALGIDPARIEVQPSGIMKASRHEYAQQVEFRFNPLEPEIVEP